MTVGFLVRMLTSGTEVLIIDQRKNKILFRGCASAANFGDIVKDWDFSDEHIIYI